MADENLYSQLQLVRMRATLLDATGAPLAGASSQVVTDQLIQLNWKVNVDAGASLTQDTGAGQRCVNFRDRDKISGVDLTMSLCSLDHELVELLTGATLARDTSGNARGWALPQINVAITRDVAIEAWTKAWSGESQPSTGGQLIHERWVFPRSTWVIGDGNLQNAVEPLPLNGKARSNSSFGDGPANDLPWGVYTSAMGVWEDWSALPASAVGYQTLTAS